jgi:hypothetical protein
LEWNFADMNYQEMIKYNSWYLNDRLDQASKPVEKQVLKISNPCGQKDQLHLEWNFADMKYQELIGYNSWFANDRFDC